MNTFDKKHRYAGLPEREPPKKFTATVFFMGIRPHFIRSYEAEAYDIAYRRAERYVARIKSHPAQCDREYMIR